MMTEYPAASSTFFFWLRTKKQNEKQPSQNPHFTASDVAAVVKILAGKYYNVF
jgi:hypothetical protein